MALISNYARKKKMNYFFKDIPKTATILEIGSGEGWVKSALKNLGYSNYTGLDISPPADIVGDIKQWRSIDALNENYYDAIVAFEVVEHVDCFQECYDLLAPGGKLFITTPIPDKDWILKIFEALHLNQKRTSPHDHLIYIKDVENSWNGNVDLKYVSGLSQWAILTKNR